MTSWTQYPPRIQFKRQKYQVLAGSWTVNGKQIGAPWDYKTSEEHLVYEHVFTLNSVMFNDDVRTVLHFEAVDQVCDVYINDVQMAHHEGGYLPFSFDISAVCLPGENRLRVEVSDTLRQDFPYGKQCAKPHGMWYTPVSGIWQPVWLEAVPKKNEIRGIRMTPDLTGIDLEIDTDADRVAIRVNSPHINFRLVTLEKKLRINVPEPRLWSPDDPYLYDIFLETDGDRVQSYFALRTVSLQNVDGYLRFCLNGQPLFLHGVLDQGYWGENAYLPAGYGDYLEEAKAMKALGFNCIRKHIKIEHEAFYYFCDYTGLLVIQDMVNSGRYSFMRDTVLPTVFGNCLGDARKKSADAERRQRFETDMRRTMALLYNHPCVVGYTIFNEGWGQFESDRMYDIAKAQDPTRFIDSTSGWFAQHKSDVQSEHIYFRNKRLKAKSPDKFLLLSECGGYTRPVEGHVQADKKKYGYGEADSEDALTEKIETMYRKMVFPSIPEGLCGCIYTQNADVEGEVNGLYTADRQVCKVDAERMRAIAEKLRSISPYGEAQKSSLKTVRVVAAVIHDGGKIYATQRGYGEFKDGWEFPGGKIEENESPEEAVVREIREELDVEVEPERLLTTIEYDYPKFHLSMDCFACRIKRGHPTLLEHEAARWLTKEQLDEVAWLPADITLIGQIRDEWEELVSEQVEIPQPKSFSDLTFER
ncbi:MAG: NUDIX domain-containing protein [Firmicutes bacterium]|nr:NUDIX domain-containing protein [Bacillota bacterium]